ncbi:MAG: RimK family alpha-L-glutamate ligase, partial [Candidatus Aenigmatarchaeota archaeon]
DPLFEESRQINVEDMAPEVIDGEAGVKSREEKISDFDAVFAEIPVENAVFGRVLLEVIEEEGVSINYPSTAFFIMAKKNYLYNVMHEKNLPAPRTVAAASEKAARSIENQLEKPLIARRFDQMVEEEKKKLDEEGSVVDFMEGINYPEEVVLFHEFNPGDKYRCLYAGGEVISLEDRSEDWKLSSDDLQYSNVSSSQEELVCSTARSIGSPVAEVILRGEQVWDVNPNPDLETYTDVSGKNAYQEMASVLKSE